MRLFLLQCVWIAGAACISATGQAAEDGKLLSIDHYVMVQSIAPAIAGQEASLYVREVVRTDKAPGAAGKPDGVVLFVHGGGTPGFVSFDLPHGSHSWMAYLARAGFDVFAMDMLGYGRSTRPAAMADPCNALPAQQKQLIPQVIAVPCAPTRTEPISTMASDWHDLGAVVDYVRAMRGVDKMSLVAWSLGGARVTGYTARNPGKVARVVALAPGYQRTGPAEIRDPPFKDPGIMTLMSGASYGSQWDRQVRCPDQFDPVVKETVLRELLASDPISAKWGVRRAPRVPSYGFNQAVVSRLSTPYLMVTGTHDGQVSPELVRQLYADLGSQQKIFTELACSSHNAMWEKNHLLLFRASLEFLREGKVNGISAGEIKLGF